MRARTETRCNPWSKCADIAKCFKVTGQYPRHSASWDSIYFKHPDLFAFATASCTMIDHGESITFLHCNYLRLLEAITAKISNMPDSVFFFNDDHSYPIELPFRGIHQLATTCLGLGSHCYKDILYFLYTFGSITQGALLQVYWNYLNEDRTAISIRDLIDHGKLQLHKVEHVYQKSTGDG